MNTYSKLEARRIVRARLGAISGTDFLRASDTIRERVRSLLIGLSANGRRLNVLSYQAIPGWREVDMSPIERELDQISFDHALSGAQAPFPAGLYDVILVPLYGFNSNGYRLGHGGGWYDRLLAGQTQAFKVGVGHEVGRIEFKVEHHDIAMDSIISDKA